MAIPDFFEAAEFVRRWAEKQRDIIALGEALKEIGSISQAATERQAALDKLTQECTARTAEIEAAKSEHAEFLASRESVLSEHQTTLQQATEAAKTEAEQIVEAAKVAAQNIIDVANAQVARTQKDHADTMTLAAAELQSVRTQVESAQREIESARTEHEALSQKIQEMKDAARGALGFTMTEASR